jgi:hypothetical protein
MALKLKISIQYINDIASPNIRILPSLASSPRVESRSASFIPAHLRSLLCSIFPPLLVSIQRIRSRGDCGGISFFYREFLFRHIHGLDYSYSMFEYQDLPLDCLDKDFVGIVAFHNACNWLATRDQPDDNFLAFELGDELWADLFWCWLGRCCFLFCHFDHFQNRHQCFALASFWLGGSLLHA